MLQRVQQELEDARNVVAGADELERRLEEGAPVESDVDLLAIRAVLAQARKDIPALEAQLARENDPAAAELPSLAQVANGVAGRETTADTSASSTSLAFNSHFGEAAAERRLEDWASQVALERDLDSLAHLQDAAQRIRTMDAVVEQIERDPTVNFALRVDRHLPSIMECLADAAGTQVRAGAYRLLRHLMVDASDAAQLTRHHLEYFLVKTLARDARFDFEKQHALRLVRAMVEHAGGKLHEARGIVPIGVLRAVIAIADAPEEKLRLAALEVLGELIVRNLALLVVSDGLRTVLEALSDSLLDFGRHAARLFLVAVDHPETRQWLRPGIDLEVVLAGFTEVYGSGALVLEKVKASAEIVAMLLKSWSGLFYLNINGRQAVTSLVDSLSNQSPGIRGVLLDMLLDVFSVRCRTISSSTRATKQAEDQMAPRRCNLVDQYLAILLLVFAEAGLADALATLATDQQDAATASKVSRLIATALPKLVALTLSFDTSDARRFASSTISSVDASRRRDPGTRLPRSFAESGSQISLQMAASQRQRVAAARRNAASRVDDITFRNLLLESEVLSTRSEVPWRCDILLDLVEGPLRDPRRLEEATKATKFMSRLLGFFHPYSLRYSDMPRTKSNEQWTRLACTLLETLLQTPEGYEYLAEDQMLRQIAESLFQIETVPTASGVESVFSVLRVERTLTRDYFKLLGALSRTEKGLRLLDQAKIFTAIHRIAELRNRDDLVVLVIQNLDYTLDGHARVFLGRALTSSFKHIRLVATRHLETLLSPVPSRLGDGGAPDWVVRLLVQQLYDSAPEIVRTVVGVLERICQDEHALDQVLALQPALELVGDLGSGLMTRFLSTTAGVRYLSSLDFIQQELHTWFEELNLQYMVDVELALAATFSRDELSSERHFDGHPPPHFYGELVRTEEGCKYLRAAGHLEDFAAIVSLHEDSDLDADYVVMLKAVLWALGHIGSSSPGLLLLDEYDLLTQIVQIAAFSPVFSLRGTATFALCLLTSTEEGAEILDELGWESVFDLYSRPVGLCVPTYLADYIATPLWDSPYVEAPLSLEFTPARSSLQREILISLANLSNHILASKSSRALSKLKMRHPAEFASPVMMRRAMQMLSEHQFRLTSRRFVLELFDAPLSPSLARKIARASRELVAGRANAGPPEDDDSYFAHDTPTRLRRRSSQMPSGVPESVLGAVEGDMTEDDTSSIDSTSKQVPTQVLTPLISIRGFLLA
ncbi:hypothetical protein C6P46_001643 [Rhodotorula mucilaginosa]|uniref:Uncharacterized protein n=1 Tax=Rhodotorula mucilaginosa TaxID=5537 RepID=A0A9P6VUF5_RHOMI|nr:hypothetical protein C6P46_001643 [Rhodotorula mucilaginosa]